MLKENSELRASALQSLKNKWGDAVIYTLVFMVISGAGSIPYIGYFAFLLTIPIGWGFYVLFLDNLRGEKMEIGKLFVGFSDYVRILGTSLLVCVYTFLWSLLLIIPGIIKACSYAMTSYILKDEPELKFNAAIEKSMDMMDGNKMKLFLMDLGFFGLSLLSIFTLFIGLLWLMPYWYSSRAAFYEDLKREASIVEQV